MKKKNLSINPIQPGDLRGDHFDWVSGGGVNFHPTLHGSSLLY